MNRKPFGLIVAIAGTFLIVAALVYIMIEYTRPAPLGENRIQERKKFLSEIQAASADALNNYGWQDQSKGWVRLKIDQAMKLTVQEYHESPAAARSNLIARADKAFAPPPPPPKVPEKPNPFE